MEGGRIDRAQRIPSRRHRLPASTSPSRQRRPTGGPGFKRVGPGIGRFLEASRQLGPQWRQGLNRDVGYGIGRLL